MTTKDRTICFAAVVIAALMISGCATQNNATNNTAFSDGLNLFQMMSAAENAKFTNFEGDTVGVTDFRGKIVMIDFWETWCRPCTSSFPAMQKLKEEYPDDFAVLAVTPGWKDDMDDAQDFSQDNAYSFNYLMDDMDVSSKIEVQAIPYKIFIDPDGNFIKSSTGSAGPQKDYTKIKNIVEKHKK